MNMSDFLKYTKIILPGLIDPHVHLRDPGQTHKEDFYTGTCAALAGGFTTIIDMPNNLKLIDSKKLLDEKMRIAKRKIVSDVGFYFGSLGDNLNEFKKVQDITFGLKLYLSQTTGGFIHPKEKLERTFKAWPKRKVILVHAEDDMLDLVIKAVARTGNKIHVCHISTKSDLKKIIKAKNDNLPISCGVTSHHLFLNEKDVKSLGSFGKMKPPLRSKTDQKFLWKNLKYIDLIESDHAPHTVDEKKSENPPSGTPGLETTLPLLLTAVNDRRLTLEEVIRLCHEGPKKVFNLKAHPQNKVEVEINESYLISSISLFTKCNWSPFKDVRVKGRIKRVFLRGKKVFENGKVLVGPGFGKIITA